MTETLKSRVARIIAGSAHALIDRIEDAAPVAMLEQAARELDAIVNEVRAELGRIAVNRHLTQQQHQRLNQEHDSLAAALSAALLIRPHEVLSCIAHAAILKVAHDPLRGFVQHRHMLVRCLTQFGFGSDRNALAHFPF